MSQGESDGAPRSRRGDETSEFHFRDSGRPFCRPFRRASRRLPPSTLCDSRLPIQQATITTVSLLRTTRSNNGRRRREVSRPSGRGEPPNHSSTHARPMRDPRTSESLPPASHLAKHRTAPRLVCERVHARLETDFDTLALRYHDAPPRENLRERTPAGRDRQRIRRCVCEASASAGTGVVSYRAGNYCRWAAVAVLAASKPVYRKWKRDRRPHDTAARVYASND